MERDPIATEGAPETGHRKGGPILRGWNGLVDGLAALGTLMIVGLMVIICADVVARNLLGASLPLVSELGALTLVMIVYLQLATTIRHDRLARTEMFFLALKQHRPRAGALLGAVFDLVGAVALGVAAWSTLGVLQKDLRAGEFIGVTGVMTLQTWPFRLMIVIGISVAAIQFCVQIWDSLRSASRASEGARP